MLYRCFVFTGISPTLLLRHLPLGCLRLVIGQADGQDTQRIRVVPRENHVLELLSFAELHVAFLPGRPEPAHVVAAEEVRGLAAVHLLSVFMQAHPAVAAGPYQDLVPVSRVVAELGGQQEI